MNIIQVGIIGVLGALAAIQFQSEKKEYGIYISVALSIFISLSIVGKIGQLIEIVKEISGYIQIETAYIGTLVKILGITYIAEFSAVLCKDTGHHTLAAQIELFGKLTILALSLPILLALLKTIETFFE